MNAPGWRKTRPLSYDEADAILRLEFGLLLSTRRLILTAAFEARPVTTPDGKAQVSYDGVHARYVIGTQDDPLDLTRGLTPSGKGAESCRPLSTPLSRRPARPSSPKTEGG